MSYLEARKLVESKTPIVGATYAAVTSKAIQKSHKTVSIEIDNKTNSEHTNWKSRCYYYGINM